MAEGVGKVQHMGGVVLFAMLRLACWPSKPALLLPAHPHLLSLVSHLLLTRRAVPPTPPALCARQTFVFAAPLPLRDRELRIEIYRTASSTQRGRLISIASVSAAGHICGSLAGGGRL